MGGILLLGIGVRKSMYRFDSSRHFKEGEFLNETENKRRRGLAA
jgi:hypothetical protein